MYSRFYIKIAEMYFGKPVGDDEVVHHMDGDQDNNDPENLVIMKRTQHSRLHGSVLAKYYGDWMEVHCSIGRFRQLVHDNKRLKKENESLERLNKKLRKAIDLLGKQ